MARVYIERDADPAHDNGVLLHLNRDEYFILAVALDRFFADGDDELVYNGQLENIRHELEHALVRE